MKKRYYCTYFNIFYAHKFLALVSSMEQYCQPYHLYCICMDEQSARLVIDLQNENLETVLWSDYEKDDDEIQAAKANRSLVEYFFTCSSLICNSFLEKVPVNDILTYLDSDMLFYANPEPIFEEMEGKSIGIIEHKFHGLGKRFLKYGRFNVGWISFRNDAIGRQCTADWRRDCLNWCYDRFEDDKFADQKYLDKWPGEYKNLKIIDNTGANVAPWNVGQYEVSEKNGRFFVDNMPIIFYHYAGFKKKSNGFYVSGCGYFFTKLTGILRSRLYQPYTNLIEKYYTQINQEKLVQLRRGKKIAEWGLRKIFKTQESTIITI